MLPAAASNDRMNLGWELNELHVSFIFFLNFSVSFNFFYSEHM